VHVEESGLRRGVDQFKAYAHAVEAVIGERAPVGAGVELQWCSSLDEAALVGGRSLDQ
jgi:hypothetical protein